MLSLILSLNPIVAYPGITMRMILYAAILTISLLTGCGGRSEAAADNPSQSTDIGIDSPSNHHLSKYPGGSYALLIGVSNYKLGWRKLPGVKRDIGNLKAVLRDQHSFQIIPAKTDMTHMEAKRALEQLLGKIYKKNSRVFIFLSGHGHVVKHRQRNIPRTFFTLTDTPSPGNAATGGIRGFLNKALAFNDLVTMIDGTRYRRSYPSHVLLVLDSCQAGNIFEYEENEFKNGGDLDAEPDEPVITVISAGSPLENVKDDGFFTKTLIEALKTPREERILTAAELGHILHAKSSLAGRSHLPLFGKLPNDSYTKRGQFIFWLPKKARTVQAPRGDTQQ